VVYDESINAVAAITGFGFAISGPAPALNPSKRMGSAAPLDSLSFSSSSGCYETEAGAELTTCSERAWNATGWLSYNVLQMSAYDHNWLLVDIGNGR